MASGTVLVVGSINVDLVVTLARLPEPGETVTGGEFARHAGGKGANQAVAAARAGARVRFVGAVGDDDLGAAAVDALAAEGVETGAIARLDGDGDGRRAHHRRRRGAQPDRRRVRRERAGRRGDGRRGARRRAPRPR